MDPKIKRVREKCTIMGIEPSTKTFAQSFSLVLDTEPKNLFGGFY